MLGYNPQRQREMLSFIGMDAASWQALAMALFWGVGGVVAVLALWLLRRMRLEDPVQRHWQRFCAKLERAGLPRAPSEGPLDFASRAAAHFPQHAALVGGIGALYIDLRYGVPADRTATQRLGRLVRQFKL